VNKELVAENQQEQTLVAGRITKDHILQVNDVTDVDITRDMVLAAWSARAKYSQYLAQKKEQQELDKSEKKTKGRQWRVTQVENKCKWLKTNISSLLSDSKEL